jgi:hypothetical protein
MHQLGQSIGAFAQQVNNCCIRSFAEGESKNVGQENEGEGEEEEEEEEGEGQLS